MAEYDSVIPPGQTGKIIAKLKTKSYRGKVRKSIRVVSNDPKEPSRFLSLNCVIRGIKMFPSSRLYFTVFEGQPQAREITLATVGEDEIKVKIDKGDFDGEISLVKLDQPKPDDNNEYWNQYKMTFTLPVDEKEGRFNGKIKLSTNSKYDPETELYYLVTVNSSININPQNLNFDDNNIQHSVFVNNKFGDDLKILDVKVEPNVIAVEIEQLEPGLQYVLKCKKQNGSEDAPVKGKIQIKTNNHFHSKIVIPFTITGL